MYSLTNFVIACTLSPHLGESTNITVYLERKKLSSQMIAYQTTHILLTRDKVPLLAQTPARVKEIQWPRRTRGPWLCDDALATPLIKTPGGLWLGPRNAAQESPGSAFAAAERDIRWRYLKAAGAGFRSYMDHVTLRLGWI